MKFKVTRAHLKSACDAQNWDLFDKLLSIDNSAINDNAIYTDTWGEWWGFLIHCIYSDYVDGVKILLKHGVDKKKGTWGDCLPMSPIEVAKYRPHILKLLMSETKPEYNPLTDPVLPNLFSELDNKINNQGNIRDNTGLVFNIEED